jgi:hypothetical protein
MINEVVTASSLPRAIGSEAITGAVKRERNGIKRPLMPDQDMDQNSNDGSR